MFRHKLRDLRRERKLTQDALAKLLNVGKTTICFLETGARDPSLDMVIKVAKAFNVTTDWLMADDSLTIKERPQANTVTIIGRSGTYTTIQLHEDEINELRNIAQRMYDSDKTKKWIGKTCWENKKH